MIRVRFHGRGGHGVKMASRILGTAAFLAGRHVQDSPVYGAERRGAAVTAFTRIDDEPILERGVAAGARIQHFERVEPSLHEIFVKHAGRDEAEIAQAARSESEGVPA